MTNFGCRSAWTRMALLMSVLVLGSNSAPVGADSDAMDPVRGWIRAVNMGDMRADPNQPPKVNGQFVSVTAYNNMRASYGLTMTLQEARDTLSYTNSRWADVNTCLLSISEELRKGSAKIVHRAFNFNYGEDSETSVDAVKQQLNAEIFPHYASWPVLCGRAGGDYAAYYQLLRDFFDQLAEIAFDPAELIWAANEASRRNKSALLAEQQRQEEIELQRERDRIAREEEEGLFVEKRKTEQLAGEAEEERRSAEIQNQRLASELDYAKAKYGYEDDLVGFWLFSTLEGEGDPEARYYLGIMYEAGKGVNRNLEQAKIYYQRAADNGITAAKSKLDDLDDLIEQERKLEEKRKRDQLARQAEEERRSAEIEKQRLAGIEKQRLAREAEEERRAAEAEAQRLAREKAATSAPAAVAEKPPKATGPSLPVADEPGADPFSPSELNSLKSKLKSDPSSDVYLAFQQESCQLAAAAEAANAALSKDARGFLVIPRVFKNADEYDEMHIASLFDKTQMPNAFFVGKVLRIQDLDELVSYTMQYRDQTYYVTMLKLFGDGPYEEYGLKMPSEGDFACGRVMSPMTASSHSDLGAGDRPFVMGWPIKLPMTGNSTLDDSYTGHSTDEPAAVSSEPLVSSCDEAKEHFGARSSASLYPQFLPLSADGQVYILRFSNVEYKDENVVSLVMGGRIRGMFKYGPQTISQTDGNTSGQYCAVGKWVNIGESGGLRVPILEAFYIGNDQ